MLPGKRSASWSSQSRPNGSPSASLQPMSNTPSPPASGGIERQERVVSTHRSSVQAMPSSHATNSPALHWPSLPQVSPPLQKRPSSQSSSLLHSGGGGGVCASDSTAGGDEPAVLWPPSSFFGPESESSSPHENTVNKAASNKSERTNPRRRIRNPLSRAAYRTARAA